MRLPILAPSRSHRCLAAVAGILLLGGALTGCGGDNGGDGSSATASASSTDPVPDWAAPVSTKGTKLATVRLEDGLSVTAYQVATVKATADDLEFAPTNAIKRGDRAALVNFVVRNDGKPVVIGDSTLKCAHVERPDGQNGIDVIPLEPEATLSAHGLNSEGTLTPEEINKKYELGTGQAYNFAGMYPFPGKSAFDLEVSLAIVVNGNVFGKKYDGSARLALKP